MDKNDAKMTLYFNKLSEPDLLKKIASDTNSNEAKQVSAVHTSSTNNNNKIQIINEETMDENNNELANKSDESQPLANNNEEKSSNTLDFTKKRNLIGLPLLCCAYFAAIYCLLAYGATSLLSIIELMMDNAPDLFPLYILLFGYLMITLMSFLLIVAIQREMLNLILIWIITLIVFILPEIGLNIVLAENSFKWFSSPAGFYTIIALIIRISLNLPCIAIIFYYRAYRVKRNMYLKSIIKPLKKNIKNGEMLKNYNSLKLEQESLNVPYPLQDPIPIEGANEESKEQVNLVPLGLDTHLLSSSDSADNQQPTTKNVNSRVASEEKATIDLDALECNRNRVYYRIIPNKNLSIHVRPSFEYTPYNQHGVVKQSSLNETDNYSKFAKLNRNEQSELFKPARYQSFRVQKTPNENQVHNSTTGNNMLNRTNSARLKSKPIVNNFTSIEETREDFPIQRKLIKQKANEQDSLDFGLKKSKSLNLDKKFESHMREEDEENENLNENDDEDYNDDNTNPYEEEEEYSSNAVSIPIFVEQRQAKKNAKKKIPHKKSAKSMKSKSSPFSTPNINYDLSIEQHYELVNNMNKSLNLSNHRIYLPASTSKPLITYENYYANYKYKENYDNNEAESMESSTDDSCILKYNEPDEDVSPIVRGNICNCINIASCSSDKLNGFIHANDCILNLKNKL